MSWYIFLEGERRGVAKLVVIDACPSPTAEVTHDVLLVQPGTDGAVSCAMMYVLFRQVFSV